MRGIQSGESVSSTQSEHCRRNAELRKHPAVARQFETNTVRIITRPC
ncbi:hypothetical protein RRSWK_01829 [Rhodopirellula sp. SWK7]|nr:hypothetical protein RRSWK_01829 [Rhodopirellula sp. SWK7]